MPWELTIISGSTAERKPLGSREYVCRHLADRLPGAELAQPPRPPDDFLSQLDPVARQAFTRSRLEACYEGNDFSIEFYCGAEDPIPDMYADVRGDGDPIRALTHLCSGTPW